MIFDEFEKCAEYLRATRVLSNYIVVLPLTEIQSNKLTELYQAHLKVTIRNAYDMGVRDAMKPDAMVSIIGKLMEQQAKKIMKEV